MTRESELREVFDELDANGDGRVSVRELEVALSRQGEASTAYLARLILAQVDSDGNGFIEVDELIDAMKNHSLEASEEKSLRMVFEAFDKDHDGFVSRDDLRELMASLGERLSEDETRLMIREGDVDGDGRICFHEFVMLIKN